MTCKFCAGLVTWRGPLGRLEFTQCDGCNATNCQIEADELNDETPEEREVFETIWDSIELGGEG